MKIIKAAPLKVFNNVKEYFSRELPEYELLTVFRCHSETASDNDNNLYFVIAKSHSSVWKNNYACWTCWNDSNKSLNSGHYCIALYDCFTLAYAYCDSLDVSTQSGVFIKTDKDFINLSNKNDRSFAVTDDNSDKSTLRLNDSSLIVFALDKEE